ncbi:hypothetical protein PG994_008361 [Apiospora phragmitis]|uniref:Uncharacterized protein n=1 Tax=Apiospora phragmitis TaxID=2905665 RepID=A0ABR1USV7_9PEZI
MPEKRQRLLHWQPGFSLARKPAKKSITRRRRKEQSTGAPQRYEFVCENLVEESGHGPRRSVERCVIVTNPEGLTTHDTAVSPRFGQLTTSNEILANNTQNISTPCSILYNSVAHRFEPILNQYNREFCKIPLTFDLQINPFQYRQGIHSEPLFLVHAAMALAGHHVESQSAEHHRGTALQLLREGLGTPGDLADAFYMLDTITILFSLDETQSAFGNWSIHLTGVFALLEACGGTHVWIKSPRAVVQVGLMVWWDAITSLVAREDCVFPYSYFEVVASSNQGEQEWDYFRLCGCPLPLVEIVMRLARLSAEKRKSAPMQYVKLDDTVISDIENSLGSWQHVSPPTADRDESSVHQDMDSMHCAEAWRHGLLLYVHRVFRWEPGDRVPPSMARCARVTADHVFACREDSSLVAKQALLPPFLRGVRAEGRVHAQDDTPALLALGLCDEIPHV